MMLVHVSSKKMCLYRHSEYHLKAHRVSNNGIKITCIEVRKKYGDCDKNSPGFFGF